MNAAVPLYFVPAKVFIDDLIGLRHYPIQRQFDGKWLDVVHKFSHEQETSFIFAKGPRHLYFGGYFGKPIEGKLGLGKKEVNPEGFVEGLWEGDVLEIFLSDAEEGSTRYTRI